jgi:AmiR/NasT family two-component response regulator
MASIVIIQAGTMTPTQVLTQTRAALDERTVIEQAKGVVAYTKDLSMDSAFDHLVSLAHDRGQHLTMVAAAVIAAATDHLPDF